MSHRNSFPLTSRDSSESFHVFAPRVKPQHFTLNCLWILSVILVSVLSFFCLFQILDLRQQVKYLNLALSEKDLKMLEFREGYKTEVLKIEREINAFGNVLSSYTEKKKALEEEKLQQNLDIESNLQLLRKDLLFSIQNYFISFYTEIFSKDLQKETDKMSESVKNIESLMYRLMEDQRPFEEKHNTINMADLSNGAQVITLSPEGFIWTTSSYKYRKTSNPLDQFLDVDNVISLSQSHENKKCYQAEGNKGILSIRLKEKQRIFGFAYEQKLKGDGDKDSMKNFQVYGLLDDQDKTDPFEKLKEEIVMKAYYLGSYHFTAGKIASNLVENDAMKQSQWKINEGNRFKQYFLCIHENCLTYEYKSIRIEYENYGEDRWTFLCRFEVLIKAKDQKEA